MSGLGYYAIKVACDNCLLVGQIDIPKFTYVANYACPRCSCKALEAVELPTDESPPKEKAA